MKNQFGSLAGILCLMAAASPLHAQWVLANGPQVTQVRSLTLAGSTIYAGTDNQGVFKSTDHGANWTEGESVAPQTTGRTGMQLIRV